VTNLRLVLVHNATSSLYALTDGYKKINLVAGQKYVNLSINRRFRSWFIAL